MKYEFDEELFLLDFNTCINMFAGMSFEKAQATARKELREASAENLTPSASKCCSGGGRRKGDNPLNEPCGSGSDPSRKNRSDAILTEPVGTG